MIECWERDKGDIRSMIIDTTLIFFGSLCMLTGIIGCFLPVLPGPPASYLGLLLLHFTSQYSFSTRLLLLYAALTIIVTIMDYLIPVFGAKKFRGSKYGIWGGSIGLIIGLIFFPPLGIVIGPVLGAFLGEFLSGKRMQKALKSALGSILGFLMGTAVNLTLSLVMTYYFLRMLI
jgi:uncharacterized protein YqgC (DUF456 family)